MSTVSARKITAEEFAAMPNPADGSTQELVRGEIVTMPPPKARHGLLQAKLCAVLLSFVEPRKIGKIAVESGVVIRRNPDTVLGPDIAFYGIDNLAEDPNGYFESPPDIAIEILSPDSRPREVKSKIREYLSCGVRMIWIVDPDPEVRTVTVYRGNHPAMVLEEEPTLDGGEILPGFICKVGDLFR